MNWRFRTIPEIADLPPAEQQRMWRAAGRDRSKRSDLLIVAVVLLAVGIPTILLLTVATEPMPAWARWPLRGVLFVVGGKIADFVIVAHYRRVVRRLRDA